MSDVKASFDPKTYVITQEYQISKDCLGDGVNGKVWKCTQLKTNTQCALKILQDREDARREIELHLAASKSPYIVQIMDIFYNSSKGTHVNHFLVVMEKMRGGELFNRITSRKKQLTEQKAAQIVYQIASAINHLHSMNVAHRDIKPENLLFENESDDSRLKLTDFGFAKRVVGQKPLKTPLFTPYYAPPEILGPENYDMSCDMWSLGVVSYILLCGYPPFYCEHNVGQPMTPGMRRRIRNGQYTFPDQEWSRVTEPAKDFVRQLLMVDPEKRPDSSQVMNHHWLRDQAIIPETLLDTQTILLDQKNTWNETQECMALTLQGMREPELKGGLSLNLDSRLFKARTQPRR